MSDLYAKSILRAARRNRLDGAIDLSQRRAWYADLVLTPANIKWISGVPPVTNLVALSALTAGQVVYLDPADNLIKAARATTDPLSAVFGILLQAANAGGFCQIAQSGARVNIGATCVAGTNYCLSAAVAGSIAPWADLVATNFVVNLFIGEGTANVTLNINKGAVAHA